MAGGVTSSFEEQQGSRSLRDVEYARPLFIARTFAFAYFLRRVGILIKYCQNPAPTAVSLLQYGHLLAAVCLG